MKTLLPRAVAALCLVALLGGQPAAAGDTLKINGSTTVNPVATRAAELLGAASGMKIQIDTQGGSTGGISALGDGLVEIGMSSRNVNESDRKKYPKVSFVQHQIGADAVAMVVSKDVWDGGVRSLTAQQVRDIYEGRTKSWKDVGGPDQRIAFFNREPGRGEWEVFGKWLYGSPKDVPLVSHLEVGGNEETRTKIGSTRGGVTFLSSVWADGERVYSLAIAMPDGQTVEATGSNIASGAYPMSRPLFLVTNGAPTGAAKTFVDYVVRGDGQKLVSENGYLRLDQLGGS